MVLQAMKVGEGELPPCIFFSHILSNADRNYDIFNKELLAIKAAFQKKRQWLERAQFPIQGCTDHKNLELMQNSVSYSQANQMESILISF